MTDTILCHSLCFKIPCRHCARLTYTCWIHSNALITAPDRTQLNSAQLAVELSWVLRVITSCPAMWSLLELNSTEIVQFFVSRGSLNKFRISTTSWVESDLAVWLHEKITTNQLYCFCSYIYFVSNFLDSLPFYILSAVPFALDIVQARLVTLSSDFENDMITLSLALCDFSVSK